MTLDLREAASRHDRLLTERLDTLIPKLMDRAGLDAWVISAREYNEDPVLQTMLPATWLDTSRRRTIVAFIRRPTGVDRVAVARYAVGDAFPAAWDPESQPDQWGRLAELIVEAGARRIGVNTSNVFPLADGLSAGERDELLARLPAHLRSGVVGAETAAIGWLETRLAQERDILAEACSVAHEFLHTALSRQVITPGSTTTEDVEWWLRNRVHAAGHGSWFHPTASIQRHGVGARASFAGKPGETVIEPGDLVHIDFGIVYHGYCTDQQQHGYVLADDETTPPAGLAAGLRTANRLQDILMSEFVAGRTGNEILTATRSAAAGAGIDGLVYTHPIGVHGHAAGPTIGLWDNQDRIDGQGDYPLWPSTAYSIELQARVPVAEWDGQVVQFMLEEDAWFDEGGCSFIDGRQTELWSI